MGYVASGYWVSGYAVGDDAGATFTLAVPGTASTSAAGTPAVSFTAPGTFTLAVPGTASTSAAGVPVVSFQLAPDGGEPVTLAQAKLAARIDINELDAEIEGLITAAREQAEHITGRCYRRQVRRTELADWPAATDAIPVHNALACEVRYWTGAAWSALPLADSAYVFAPGGIGYNATVLAPAAGTSWPALGDRPVGPRVRIDLTAGDETDVPAQVKLFIKAQVAAWVNDPEAIVGKDLQVSPLLARLLDAQRLWC